MLIKKSAELLVRFINILFRILCRHLKHEDGASAVLVALVVVMLLGFTALAIDVGYMYSTRNELQNIADAAALAGAGELGGIYLSLNYAAQQAFDVDATGMGYRTQIENTAKDTAVKNKAAGQNISISSADITIGTWNWNITNLSMALTSNNIRPDAVRAVARRDSTLNNAVSTFFGPIFSFFGGSADTFEVVAVATAALSGPSIIDEGVLNAPFGISENSICPNLISFSPTTDSCAGWHNFFDSINASAVADKMLGFIEAFQGTSTTEGHDWLETHFDINPSQVPDPEVTPQSGIGSFFEFQGGTIASLFASGGYYDGWNDKDTPSGAVQGNDKKPVPFINLFDFYRFRDGDGDGSMGETTDVCGTPMNADLVWTATIPVYKDGATCSNPTGSVEIVGFASVKIIMPNPPPNNTIDVCLNCDGVIEPGRGGGGAAGNVLGSIPNLVQ